MPEDRDDGLRAVTDRDLDRYMGLLFVDGLLLETRRSRAHALKALFRFLTSRRYIPSNPAADLRAPAKRSSELVPVFSPQEVEALIFRFAEAPPERQPGEPGRWFEWRLRRLRFTRARDTACLAVCYTCGLRVSEPAGLELRDYAVVGKSPALVLREYKRSTKPFIFRLDRRVQGAVEIYLRNVPVRNGVAGLFPPCCGPGLFLWTRSRRGPTPEDAHRQTCGGGHHPSRRRLSFHVFRYSIATHLHDNGRGLSPAALSAYMRHADFETTLRYIRLGSMASTQRQAIACCLGIGDAQLSILRRPLPKLGTTLIPLTETRFNSTARARVAMCSEVDSLPVMGNTIGSCRGWQCRREDG